MKEGKCSKASRKKSIQNVFKVQQRQEMKNQMQTNC